MTIKEKVKELWKLCFNDSEEFIELYFRLRYTNKASITIQSGDEIISALQMVPYIMTYCGSQIGMSYVSGACTHPEYRNNGVMKELLSQAFVQMMRKGIPVSTLIPAEPWLFDYYAKLGYAPAFSFVEDTILPNQLQSSKAITVKHSTRFNEKSFIYFNEKMLERPCCIQHNDEIDYTIILEDLALSGGNVYVAQEKGITTGILFAVPEGDALLARELFADNAQTRDTLLREAALHNHSQRISLFSPSTGKKNEVIHQLGMIRIIYAKGVLQLYAAANPKIEMNIELTDEQISKNNGYYYIVNGKCMTTKKKLPGSHLQLTIDELAQIVFSPYKPYMSLMLN